jgi:CBS domain containing-hemolysin-like protein
MPATWPRDRTRLSSLPFSAATAALLVAGLCLLLALLEAALTGLSRGNDLVPYWHPEPGPQAGRDPARMRRVGAVLRVVLLIGIGLLSVAAGLAGRSAPAIVAVAALSILHLLEQQGRLRLFGAHAPWLAAGAAIILRPLSRLVPAGRQEGGDGVAAAAGALEDMADLLATAPEDRQQMVQALLGLEHTMVEDIMIPRNEVVGINLRSDWDEIVDQLARTPHTRLPLYDGDLERVIGVVHMKRVANELASGRLTRERLREVATQRDAVFVPEGTSLQSQLIAFRKLKRRIAFVVDEYGDVLGLVTLEDILEEIVGDFTRQPGSLNRDVIPQPDGSFVVAGGAAVRAVNRALGWTLPTDGPRTVSGLIVEYLEAIPTPGTSLKLGGHPVEILQIADNTVRTARVWPAAAD